MSKAAKLGAITGGLVLAAVFAAAAAVFVLVDVDTVTDELQRRVQEATGRRLTLGDAGLKLGFSPSLVLRDLALENAPWGSRPELLRVGRFEIRIALLPLIAGRIDVRRFVFTEADLLIEIDAAGRSNLAFNPDERTAAGHAGEISAAPDPMALPAIAVRDLRVRRLHLTLRNQKSGTTHRARLADLSARSQKNGGLVAFQSRGDVNGTPFAAEGSVGAAAALLGGASDGTDPCLEVLDAVRRAQKPRDEGDGAAADSGGDSSLEKAWKGLKGLFGR